MGDLESIFIEQCNVQDLLEFLIAVISDIRIRPTGLQE